MNGLKEYVVDYTVVQQCTVKAKDLKDAEVSARYLVQLLAGKSAKLLRVCEISVIEAVLLDIPPATPRSPKKGKRKIWKNWPPRSIDDY